MEATYAVHGTTYTVISVTAQFGVSSGGSVDTALGIIGAKYSMAHELRDTGEFGFLLPPGQVIHLNLSLRRPAFMNPTLAQSKSRVPLYPLPMQISFVNGPLFQ